MIPEASLSAWGKELTELLCLFVLEFSSSCCEAGRNCSPFPEQPNLDGTNCQISVRAAVTEHRPKSWAGEGARALQGTNGLWYH